MTSVRRPWSNNVDGSKDATAERTEDGMTDEMTGREALDVVNEWVNDASSLIDALEPEDYGDPNRAVAPGSETDAKLDLALRTLWSVVEQSLADRWELRLAAVDVVDALRRDAEPWGGRDEESESDAAVNALARAVGDAPVYGDPDGCESCDGTGWLDISDCDCSAPNPCKTTCDDCNADGTR